MKVCARCGARLVVGRASVHLSGECLLPWYQTYRAKCDAQKRQRRAQREARENMDLPPAIIERIMARRALEQRYERAMAQAVVVSHDD